VRALSLEVKQQGHEADHSPPSFTEVKNVWSYSSNPPGLFMALFKHRGIFTFTSSVIQRVIFLSKCVYYRVHKLSEGRMLQQSSKKCQFFITQAVFSTI
jgi:hypothetical protein